MIEGFVVEEAEIEKVSLSLLRMEPETSSKNTRLLGGCCSISIFSPCKPI